MLKFLFYILDKDYVLYKFYYDLFYTRNAGNTFLITKMFRVSWKLSSLVVILIFKSLSIIWVRILLSLKLSN